MTLATAGVTLVRLKSVMPLIIKGRFGRGGSVLTPMPLRRWKGTKRCGKKCVRCWKRFCGGICGKDVSGRWRKFLTATHLMNHAAALLRHGASLKFCGRGESESAGNYRHLSGGTKDFRRGTEKRQGFNRVPSIGGVAIAWGGERKSFHDRLAQQHQARHPCPLGDGQGQVFQLPQ